MVDGDVRDRVGVPLQEGAGPTISPNRPHVVDPARSPEHGVASPTLVLNSDYSATDVPVPSAISGGRIVLTQ